MALTDELAKFLRRERRIANLSEQPNLHTPNRKEEDFRRRIFDALLAPYTGEELEGGLGRRIQLTRLDYGLLEVVSPTTFGNREEMEWREALLAATLGMYGVDVTPNPLIQESVPDYHGIFTRSAQKAYTFGEYRRVTIPPTLLDIALKRQDKKEYNQLQFLVGTIHFKHSEYIPFGAYTLFDKPADIGDVVTNTICDWEMKVDSHHRLTIPKSLSEGREFSQDELGQTFMRSGDKIVFYGYVDQILIISANTYAKVREILPDIYQLHKKTLKGK